MLDLVQFNSSADLFIIVYTYIPTKYQNTDMYIQERGGETGFKCFGWRKIFETIIHINSGVPIQGLPIGGLGGGESNKTLVLGILKVQSAKSKSG